MNRNGRLLTEFCNEEKYKIMNTFKRVKKKISIAGREIMEKDKV